MLGGVDTTNAFLHGNCPIYDLIHWPLKMVAINMDITIEKAKRTLSRSLRGRKISLFPSPFHIADINECLEENGMCMQLCINLNGSHSCECFDGYAYDEAGTTCIGTHIPRILSTWEEATFIPRD